MRGHRRTILSSFASGLTLVLALGALSAAPVMASNDDLLAERTDTTYRLLPDEQVIRVNSTVTLTNKSKPTVRTGPCKNGKGRCKITTRYYFHGWNAFWTPLTAQDVQIGGPNVKALPAEEVGGGLSYAITYPKLWNKKGAKQKANISFDVPAGTVATTDAPTRIEDGYAHFCWWGMVGDTGTTKLILPPGWVPVTPAAGVAVERSPDGIVMRAKNKKNPTAFVDCFEAVNLDRFEQTYVTGADGKSLVVVEAWPGDEAWANDMTEVAVEALPKLETMLGTPLPLGEVRVREVATQSREFLVGDLRPTDGVLSMAEDADADALLPERLARSWFDPEQFRDPWLSEGLALWLATQTSASRACADTVEHPGPDAPDLDAWTEPTSYDVLALHQWQRVTACHLIESGAEVIGDAAMIELITELIAAPVPVGTSHWLAGVSRDLPDGLDSLVAELTAAGVDH